MMTVATSSSGSAPVQTSMSKRASRTNCGTQTRTSNSSPILPATTCRSRCGPSRSVASRHAEKLDGEAREFLEYVTGGASRMELLVRDLLAYTQVTKLPAPKDFV